MRHYSLQKLNQFYLKQICVSSTGSQQVLYEFFAEIIFCSCIAISYIELHTPLIGHVVVGVVEVDVPLFSPQCEPALSQTKLYTLYYVTTTALFCVRHSVDYITQGSDSPSQEQLIIQVYRNKSLYYCPL